MIFYIVDELLNAGIEKIVIVVQPNELDQFERLFQNRVEARNAKLLDQNGKVTAKRIEELGRHVSFVVQNQQLGLGHAIYCAREVLESRSVPFIVALGHHLYRSFDRTSCVQQLLDIHVKLGSNVIGLKVTSSADVEKFGAVAGTVHNNTGLNHSNGMDGNEKLALINVTKCVEKPTQEYARQNLQVNHCYFGESQTKENGTDTSYLTAFGLYLLNGRIISILEKSIAENDVDSRGMVGLTPALDQLRQEEGLIGYVVAGERLAVRDPISYLDTVKRFSEQPELREL